MNADTKCSKYHEIGENNQNIANTKMKIIGFVYQNITILKISGLLFCCFRLR